MQSLSICAGRGSDQNGPDRGDAGFRPNDQSRDPGAIDAGDRRRAVTSLVAGAEFALCLAVPFFFSGVVVSLALTRSTYPIGKVYGADLIGAATGCIGVLALLNAMSGPSAVLWVGGLIALAALGFAGSGVGALPKFTSLGSPLFRYRRSIVTGCLLGDCQHAHEPWRSTDHHHAPLIALEYP